MLSSQVGYERLTYPSAYLSHTNTFSSEFLTGIEKAGVYGRLVSSVHTLPKSAKSSEDVQVKCTHIHRLSTHYWVRETIGKQSKRKRIETLTHLHNKSLMYQKLWTTHKYKITSWYYILLIFTTQPLHYNKLVG